MDCLDEGRPGFPAFAGSRCRLDAGGVSSSGSRLTKAEKAKIIARYYTTEELAANRAGQKVCWTVKLFGFLVLLKIRKEPFQDTFRVNLFGFVPLLKIRKNTK